MTNLLIFEKKARLDEKIAKLTALDGQHWHSYQEVIYR